MNKLFVTAIATLSLFAVSALPAAAQNWPYDSHFVGDNDLDFSFEFTETEDWTVLGGAEYNFGGGAGSDGSADANGDFSWVGGAFGEYAYGTGDAYGDTLGNNYATANFHSGSGSLNGGYALNTGGSWNDWAQIDYVGIVTAGGAGSVQTGLSYGTEYTYSIDGLGEFNYDLANSGYYNETP